MTTKPACQDAGVRSDTAPTLDAAEDANTGYVRRRVTRHRHGRADTVDDAITEEVPIAMVYNGAPFAVMMATPLDLDDFALGFSLSERLIPDAAALTSVEIRPRLEGIELAMEVAADARRVGGDASRERLLPGRSGCGICGARTLEDAVRHPQPVAEGSRIDARNLKRALSALRTRQPINAATGSVHAAAWADVEGHILLVREDVGRHNALDKLIGAMAHAAHDPEDGFLIITSRASYEMVTKAAMAGITLLAAISAPTALAIHLAQETGMTLIGFARADGHVVYAHPRRLSPRGTQAPGNHSRPLPASGTTRQ